MSYLETIGKMQKAYEDIKGIEHKKIKSSRKLQSITFKKYNKIIRKI